MGLLAQMINQGSLQVESEETSKQESIKEEIVKPCIYYSSKTIITTIDGVKEFEHYDSKYEEPDVTPDIYDVSHCCKKYVELVLKFYDCWDLYLKALSYYIINELCTREESYAYYRVFLQHSMDVLMQYNPLKDSLYSDVVNTFKCIAPSLNKVFPKYPCEKSAFQLAEEKGPNENGIISICNF